MDVSFWHNSWDNNNIGFHEEKPSRILVDYFAELSLKRGSRVFLPLCGKTLAFSWLLSKGYRAAGCELSAIAIDELFVSAGPNPQDNRARRNPSLQRRKY